MHCLHCYRRTHWQVVLLLLPIPVAALSTRRTSLHHPGQLEPSQQVRSRLPGPSPQRQSRLLAHKCILAQPDREHLLWRPALRLQQLRLRRTQRNQLGPEQIQPLEKRAWLRVSNENGQSQMKEAFYDSEFVIY